MIYFGILIKIHLLVKIIINSQAMKLAFLDTSLNVYFFDLSMMDNITNFGFELFTFGPSKAKEHQVNIKLTLLFLEEAKERDYDYDRDSGYQTNSPKSCSSNEASFSPSDPGQVAI